MGRARPSVKDPPRENSGEEKIEVPGVSTKTKPIGGNSPIRKQR